MHCCTRLAPFIVAIGLRRSAAFVSPRYHFVLYRPHFRLFATSPSTPPRNFGQLLSSFDTMALPSCPCCALISGDLFLPWKEGEVQKPVDFETVTESVDVMSPSDAWKVISDNNDNEILLVDTHGHAHLQRDIEYAKSDVNDEVHEDERVVSLTCAVSHVDWKDTLDYASKSKSILPALGIHPWYIGDILVENSQPEDVEKHLSWDWLERLEQYLSQHPSLVVGEIGLCKMAKFVRKFPKEQGGKATALQLQKLVFRKQMELAAKWCRPVTVHCVNMHGSLMEVFKQCLRQAIETYNSSESAADESNSLQDFVRSQFPPSIALHSFTGTAHHVQEILQLEEDILNPDQIINNEREYRKNRNQKQQLSGHVEEERLNNSNNKQNCLFYFGFSHAVNHIMCTSDKARRRGMEAVRAVPPDRLLAESDVHNTADVTLGTAGAVAYIAASRGDKLMHVAEQTTINGLRYLSSLSLPLQLINSKS